MHSLANYNSLFIKNVRVFRISQVTESSNADCHDYGQVIREL